MQAAARTAWRVLHHCRRQPGAQPDGTIDRDAFVKFIDERQGTLSRGGQAWGL